MTLLGMLQISKNALKIVILVLYVIVRCLVAPFTLLSLLHKPWRRSLIPHIRIQLMQNTAMFAEHIQLCKFYQFIRMLYDCAFKTTKQLTYFEDDISGLEFKPSTYKEAETKAAYLVIHGGGFIYGSPLTVSKFSEHLCQITQCNVIALKYPLAPEHKFPEPLIYVTRALRYFCSRYDKLHVVGVSAGANLALSATTLLNHVRSKQRPAQLTLIGGPYSFNNQSKSYHENGDGPKLTKEMIAQYWSLYMGTSDISNLYKATLEQFNPKIVTIATLRLMKENAYDYLAYAAPLDSSQLYQLPKTIILVAQEDVLLSDSIALYRKLQNENSRVFLKVYPGAHIHLAEGNSDVEEDIMKHLVQ